MLSQKSRKKKTGIEIKSVNYFKFLGTGGARFVVARQLRSSGGVYLELLGKKIILDPGPGALVRLTHSRPAIDPAQIEAIFLTHKHIDHSNDINILIDAMTAGGLKKRGFLFAPRECLQGREAVVLRYLKSLLGGIEVLEAEKDYRLGELRVRTSLKHLHEAETYGLKFYLPHKVIGFMVDTKFFPELLDSYREVNILVLNVLRKTQADSEAILHLTLPEATRIIQELRPERAYLTHFGMTMLRANPRQIAEDMSKETGVEVLAAYDGLRVLVD